MTPILYLRLFQYAFFLSLISPSLAEERDWTNSKLTGWPVAIETTGKSQGFYQLSCTWARSRLHGEARRFRYNAGPRKLDQCETSCRCNAFGEFLLNPLEDEYCNTDLFLQECVGQADGEARCECKWIRDGAEGTGPWKDVRRGGWRTDQNWDWVKPIDVKDAPGAPHKTD